MLQSFKFSKTFQNSDSQALEGLQIFKKSGKFKKFVCHNRTEFCYGTDNLTRPKALPS